MPDLDAENAFDHVFKDAKTPFDYIIHTASPVTFTVTDFQKDLIDPAVKGCVDRGVETICLIKRLICQKYRRCFEQRSSTWWIQYQAHCPPRKRRRRLGFFQRHGFCGSRLYREGLESSKHFSGLDGRLRIHGVS